MPADYQALSKRAAQQYDAAFHLLNVTFPVVKDPKMLMGVVHNIFQSLEASMEAILAYERELQLVPHYLDNFQSKFNLFRYKSAKRNQIPTEIVGLMENLWETLELHRKSPMEFQRGNRLVICSHDYQLKIISLKDLSEYLGRAKVFLELTGEIITSLDRKE